MVEEKESSDGRNVRCAGMAEWSVCSCRVGMLEPASRAVTGSSDNRAPSAGQWWIT